MANVKAPKGTKDIFLPEIEKWQYIGDRVREFFGRFLYSEIRTPVFEHSELFLRGIGSETEVVQKEMYTFEDKKGRNLTLRPENTASVVRAAIEHNLFDKLFPLKLFYFGPMFRYDKPQKGRYRQFHQFGIEVLGDDTPEVDAEVVFASWSFLKDLGIPDVNLLVNSVGCRECRPGFLRILSEAAAEREERLCSDCKRKISTNPLRIFDCKVPGCNEVASELPVITDNLCGECDTHFTEFKRSLDLLEVDYTVDSTLVRGLDYYTKTAFEITSGKLGAQNALLGGGRYNDLIKDLGGPDVPGIGFAAGVERILLHLEETEVSSEQPVFVAFQNRELKDEAVKLIKELWMSGIKAFMDYKGKNMQKQFKKSDKINAGYTLVIGGDELAAGVVSVKNMEKSVQEKIKREELIKWLKENI